MGLLTEQDKKELHKYCLQLFTDTACKENYEMQKGIFTVVEYVLNQVGKLPIDIVSFSLLEQITANAITGIMANPNAMPTTAQNFHDIAEDAVRIGKETVRQLNNES
jgi:hypothetical protein